MSILIKPNASVIRNLVPRFIQEQFELGHSHGRFEAVALFMDISGFTSMAQSFVHHDKEGTEELAQIINAVFEPIILAIYERGGFVTGFAGDALTIIFPEVSEKIVLSACETAITIRNIFEAHEGYQTTLGKFDLAVKQGMAAGAVEWGISGTAEHKAYYFRGTAIERCIQAEEPAMAGDIVLDSNIQSMVSGRQLKLKKLSNQHAYLHKLSTPPEPLRIPAADLELSESTLQQFFPLPLWQHTHHGEFRQASIVFISFEADIDQQQLESMIESAVDVCDQFGGHFIEVDFGDKGGVIMVCFGAPKAYENNIDRALGFALSLGEKLEKLKIKWRSGITFGQVYAGMVGTPLRSKYALMGNVVNLAARLMVKAEHRQILVSDIVAQQSRFLFQPLGQIKYKGFDQPLLTYQLKSQNSYHDHTDIEQIEQTVFVGRSLEQKQLQEFAQPLLAGKPTGSAIIYGEPGIGKSLLANNFQAGLSQSIDRLACHADQILGQAFNPFISCLKREFEQSPDASQTDNKKAFLSHWEKLAGDLNEHSAPRKLQQEFKRTRSILGALLNLHWKDSLYEQLDRDLRYENSITAIKTWLFARSSLTPTLLFLEDGHWLDQSSLELVQNLSEEIASYPLFVVITSRYLDDGLKPEYNLSNNSPILEIELGELPSTAVFEQAEQILGAPLADSFANLLQQRTQGNPFFVQQLIYYFQDNNLLSKDDDGKWIVEIDQTPLPITINAILVARIDRLLERAKEVVQTAAVLGAEFEIDVLKQMLQKNITSEVQEAETNRIWRNFDNLKYIFNHVMLRDAAYDMQLREQLRRLHILAASAYERLHANNLGPYFAALAYHYQVAHEPFQEQKYAILAGKRAREKGNQYEAIRYFSRAIELTTQADETNRPKICDLLLYREDSYHMLGDRVKQAEDILALSQIAFSEPMNSSQQLENLKFQVEVILRQTRYRSAISDYSAAIIAAQRAMHLAQQAGGLTQEIQSRHWWGEALERQGHYDEAIHQFNLGLKLLKAKPDPRMKARMLREIGWIAFRRGDTILSIEKLGEALLTAQLSDNRREELIILKALGGAANSRGDYRAAQAWQLQGLAIAHEIGHRQEEGSLLNNLGNTSRFLGEYEMAQSYYQRSLTQLRKTGWRIGEAISHINLGLVSPYLNAYDKAFYHAQSGLEIAQTIQARMIEGTAWYVLGNIATDEQQWIDAKLAYQKAIEINSSLSLPHYMMEAKAGLIRVFLAQKQINELAQPLADILAYLGAGHSVQAVIEPIRVYLTCFQALRALNDPRAERILREAFTLLDTHKARLPNQDARRLYLENIPFHKAVMNAHQDIIATN